MRQCCVAPSPMPGVGPESRHCGKLWAAPENSRNRRLDSSASRIVELGGEKVTICPIVCTNDDNVLVACDAAPVKEVLASSTELEVATIDPEHNRFTRSFCGRIDIEVQAVLTFTRITASTEYSDCEVAMCCRI